MRKRWNAVLLGAFVGVVTIGVGTVPAIADGTPGPVALPADTVVVDGGFEPPGVEDVVGSYAGYTATDNPQLGAWTVLTNGVDLVGVDPAAEGHQFIDLNGNDNSAPGSISQTITTTPGHRYQVRFQMAGNQNGDPPVKNLDVTLGATTRSFTFDVREITDDSLGWAEQQFEAAICEGDSGGTALTFTSTIDGQRGPLIDAVSVVDLGGGCGGGVPVWQWVMLGGTGAAWLTAFVFLGLRLTRRRAAPAHLRPAGR